MSLAFDRAIPVQRFRCRGAFCGDMNVPRGNETFNRLAEKYKDNIPLEYKTSIDQNLHRVKGLQVMVDGLYYTHL